jgi:hypothetical protein
MKIMKGYKLPSSFLNKKEDLNEFDGLYRRILLKWVVMEQGVRTSP